MHKYIILKPVDDVVLDAIVSLDKGCNKFYSPYFVTRRLRKQGLNITTEEVEDSLLYLEHYGRVVGCDYCGENFAPSITGKLYLRRN